MTSNENKMLFVGGLTPEATEEVLHAAFIPFGELKSVQVAKDYTKNKSKGYGFVEYDSQSDCMDALENMDGAELYGKTIRVSIAKPNSASAAVSGVDKGKAIWSTDEWIASSLTEYEDGDNN